MIGYIQLFATVVVAGANVMLARFTYGYVRLTRAMVEELQRARLASVVVDLAFDDWGASFVVANSGTAPATDISFSVTDDVAWNQNRGVQSLDIVRRGISYLPGGRTLKYLVGVPDWKAIEGSASVVAIGLKYKSEGKDEDREFVIDLAQFVGSTGAESPIDKVVKAIERLANQDRMRRSFERYLVTPTKICVECAEQIPAAAKKCSRCGANQPPKLEPGEGGTPRA